MKGADVIRRRIRLLHEEIDQIKVKHKNPSDFIRRKISILESDIKSLQQDIDNLKSWEEITAHIQSYKETCIEKTPLRTIDLLVFGDLIAKRLGYYESNAQRSSHVYQRELNAKL